MGDATGVQKEAMKKYEYVLFDWDGCLAKTLDIWLAAYKEVFAEYNLYPEDKIIIQQLWGDWQGARKLGIDNIEEYNKKLLIALNKKYPSLEFYDHALDVLRALKKRTKMLALITSSKRETVLPVLNHHGLIPFFETIFTAEDVTKHKPDPEVIFKTLTALHADKAASILVGDSRGDIEGARNAGIDSVLFYPKHNEPFYDKEALLAYEPTHVIDDLNKLLEIIT